MISTMLKGNRFVLQSVTNSTPSACITHRLQKVSITQGYWESSASVC